MNEKGIQYEFMAKPWHSGGQGGWYFVSVPVSITKEIRESFKQEEEGWGRLKAIAKIGHSEWKTAIWFDSKKATYLLPLKAAIRVSEKLEVGKDVQVTFWI